ncbi:glycoside hydrolase family 73 protein [Vagococcus entomophilus]|uniref:N-acetylmuramoyl-L-alanine amidase n=1 Tax=Vagococcus entomophilus TaxID=1160095 RepID=A0A430AEP4_9ENTE|nr:glycoside hydrolase family 73 protein [Vagococcus entomophilus]RSU05929.1 N-acetylmuramoyl-L-alanine amidase [Vagococcus entomophilus]
MSKLKRKRQKKIKQVSKSVAKIVSLFLILGMLFIVVLQHLSTSVQQTNDSSDTQEQTQQTFIAELLPHAKELQKQYGILPSIILGQAILESDWGKSQLGKDYHNLFGIKAGDAEDKVELKTKEYEDGKWKEITAAFKVYPNWQASMTDHTLLFVNGVSWNTTIYQNVLKATNYKVAAQALQDAGYATDPDYASKITSVIETYQLNQYD